jgi:hypothetical protein
MQASHAFFNLLYTTFAHPTFALHLLYTAQVLQRAQVIGNNYNSEAVAAIALILESIDAERANRAREQFKQYRSAMQQELRPGARDDNNSRAQCSHEQESVYNHAASTSLFSLADIEAFTAAAPTETAIAAEVNASSENNIGHEHPVESAITWSRCAYWNPCAIGLALGQSITVSLAL